jgi:hypothetical protein
MKANLFNLGLLTIIALLLLGLFMVFQNPPGPLSQDISFSQLLNDVDQGKVRDVVIQGPEIHGNYTDGRGFSTYAPNDPILVDRLYKKQVTITARPSQDVPWFVSLLVSWLPLIGVWIFLSRQIQGARLYRKGTISKTLLDDPKYWRNRTTEAYSLAEQLADPESKRHMLEIAKGYEQLALKIEEKFNGSEQSK